MATLWVTMLLVVLATTLEAKAFSEAYLQTNTQDPSVETLSVFQKGCYETKSYRVEESHDLSGPPKPLYVVSPITAGSYPILLFIHGTAIGNSDYGTLFEHIASHGFIIVAPQLWDPKWIIPIIPSQCEEIKMTAWVANWLPTNLQKVLPEGVNGDINMLAASGHSRGGKTAFALAMGKFCVDQPYALQVKISGIVGLDPVAGTSRFLRTEPRILTYKPNSFDIFVPTLVIGTGLGNHSKWNLPYDWGACARTNVSHEEFYNECRGNSAHFVVMDYGHLDMLDGDASFIALVGNFLLCDSGTGPRDPMKRTVGGLFVAYLKYALLGEPTDYAKIIKNPSLAPARLAKPNVKFAKKEVGYYSQM